MWRKCSGCWKERKTRSRKSKEAPIAAVTRIYTVSNKANHIGTLNTPECAIHLKPVIKPLG